MLNDLFLFYVSWQFQKLALKGQMKKNDLFFLYYENLVLRIYMLHDKISLVEIWAYATPAVDVHYWLFNDITLHKVSCKFTSLHDWIVISALGNWNCILIQNLFFVFAWKIGCEISVLLVYWELFPWVGWHYLPSFMLV